MEGIIHIAGAMPRMGTTTAAMQLIHFLKRNNYEAAYAEMNTQDYIWGTTQVYKECVMDKIPGKVTYSGIDLYSKERLSELVSGGTHYDYLICDFGNIQSKTFDMQAFTNCSAMIIVAGDKSNEIFYTESALKHKALDNAIYVFNFIQRSDEADILDMMQDKTKRTAFMPYMPDPYIEIENDDVNKCYYTVMNNVVELTGGI